MLAYPPGLDRFPVTDPFCNVATPVAKSPLRRRSESRPSLEASHLDASPLDNVHDRCPVIVRQVWPCLFQQCPIFGHWSGFWSGFIFRFLYLYARQVLRESVSNPVPATSPSATGRKKTQTPGFEGYAFFLCAALRPISVAFGAQLTHALGTDKILPATHFLTSSGQ